MTKKINEQMKRLEQLRNETSYLESQIKESESKERKIAKTLPKLGKKIYIPKAPEDYSPFLEGDVVIKEGGLAKVVKITSQMPFYVTVSVKGDINEYRRFTKDYSWETLSCEQEKLKKTYGGKSALVDEGYHDRSVHRKEMTDLLDW